jgi:hypothetical protein
LIFQEYLMSKPKNRVATALALTLIIPFAAGVVHAADPTKTVDPAKTAKSPATEKMAAPAADKIPPPTIDTNNDGKADAWDRDSNGVPDAWDVNGDAKPDLLDNNGDGKPDEGKAPPPEEGSPEQRQ